MTENVTRDIRSALRAIRAELREARDQAVIDWPKIQRKAAVAERLAERLGSRPEAVAARERIIRMRDYADEHRPAETANMADVALSHLVPLLAAEVEDRAETPPCDRCQQSAARYVRVDGQATELLCIHCLAGDCRTHTAEEALARTWKIVAVDLHNVLRAGRDAAEREEATA